jgi:1-acyl-sn-glycerol-3-phosphate acyltransferase
VLIANHDSAWDPLVSGVATRGRQLHASAKSSLCGPPRPEESAMALTRGVVRDVREGAPYVVPGRGRKAAGFRRLAAEYAAWRQQS